MLIEDKEKIEEIYKFLWNKLKFKPSIHMDVKPFDIEGNFLVYNIENMSLKDISFLNDFILYLFSEIDINLKFYAIDYQHGTFLSNVNNIKEDINNPKNVFYPSFYPDGDYYFFIDENFRFGYLSHPWRKEVYIFGDIFINKILNKRTLFEDTLKWKKIN